MGKVVFITGAVRNSGLAIAEKFAAQGYDLCITSRVAADAEAKATELAAQYGVQAKGYGLDMEDTADIARVFASVEETFGRLDALVCNSAHLGIGQTALSLTPEDFDSVMNVNIRGNFFCCQEAAKRMCKQGGGAIVMIGSIHYKGAVHGRMGYAISKGAVASMVHNLAFELAEYGIRVNHLIPGAIRTERWEGISEEETARRRANWPLGMESTGEDIANAVYFLASDQAKTITGAELAVDSGLLTCLLSYSKSK
ncbi:MAG: SDR family oxidoreductase [Oscillospiraceae bacterium]|nr:SDR family oxidoreductase [Oscillospiraceae bacterium]